MPSRSLSTAAEPGVRLGFYGKIPSRGDFVRHGLSRALISCWDGWLQNVLAKVSLSEGWTEAWDAAPAWHLALDAGLCGSRPVLGVMLPSADRSGRRFPLLCAAEGVADMTEADRFTAILDKIGHEAIEAECAPEDIRARLAVVGSPDLACAAVGERAVRGRWWCPNNASEISLPAMPDAATFRGMMQP